MEDTNNDNIMKDRIKEILKDQNTTWYKLSSELNEDRTNLKRSTEAWANKLNDRVNQIGYEVVFRKLKK